MDTDDLSIEAYEGILVEAERLSHDLTPHYGLLSCECGNEREYLDKAEQLTADILRMSEPELEDLFWGNVPAREKLDLCLGRIISNIREIRKIPINKRHFD